MPDVIFDRIPSRRIERRPKVRRAKRRLIEALGDRYFNRDFFDKWRVHAIFAADPDVSHLIPSTDIYRGWRQARRWLDTYPTVWIKLRHGTQGKGITVVRRRPGGAYSVYRLVDDRWRGRRVGSLAGVLPSPRRRGRRRFRYVIQQGLHLSRYRGRRFDLRVLVQKDGTGRWVWTKTVARIAGRGSVTSNISTGGRARPFSRVIRRASGRGLTPRRREELGEVLKDVSLRLAVSLEKGLGYRLAEVALDLAVDVSGRVWLIEANAKPFRFAGFRPGRQGPVRRSMIRPLQYAAYLVGENHG